MNKKLVGVAALLALINFSLVFLPWREATPPAVTTPIVVQVPVEVQPQPLPETPAPLPQPEVLPAFTEVAATSQPRDDSAYSDIMSHSKGATFGDAHGRSTNAHETTHGINSEVRNAANMSGSGKRFNAMYVLNGKAVLIEEPNIRKRFAAQFLPESLRSYRYDTYITGQAAWDDTPLYILDEWSAYINGGMVNVEDVKTGRYPKTDGRTDGVYGCLDFSIYSIALAMAVKEYDPEYFESNTQFRTFLIWNMKRAKATFEAGRTLDPFVWPAQDQLLKNLREHPEGQAMRDFINKYLDGIWLE